MSSVCTVSFVYSVWCLCDLCVLWIVFLVNAVCLCELCELGSVFMVSDVCLYKMCALCCDMCVVIGVSV